MMALMAVLAVRLTVLALAWYAMLALGWSLILAPFIIVTLYLLR